MKVYINIESIDNGFLVRVFDGGSESIEYAVRDEDELLDSLEAALARPDEFAGPVPLDDYDS